MKITDVQGLYLSLPQVQDRTDSSQDALVVVVSTDAGIVGYGEVDSCPSVVKAIIEAPKSHTLVTGLRELLVGEDPLDTRVLWEKMYARTLYYGRQGAVIHAMAGIDMALWDIKGKALGLPVHRLLGGAFRHEVPAYASQLFGNDPEETRERAKRALDAGYRAMKFGWEPFGRDARQDEELVRSIRQAVGPEVAVMVDAGLAWDAATAIERCRILEPYGILWLEEPLPPDDLHGYARLTSQVGLRIAAGEEESTLAGFERLMDSGISVVQVDVSRVGITQAVAIADAAARRGLKVCNHNFTTDINVAAALHVLAAVPNAMFLEYCIEPSPLRQGITRTPIEVREGMAKVPDAPGLGIEVDLEAVQPYLVR